ncbi:LysR family transcriptional regulator [Erwinia sp. S43]|uniref:LysR family transcriptional regulator n=1 Tax=Pantoea coffeiphila TaxID=1465635 RepID=A0A2S9IGX4_9GAMM|nr:MULTISPECIES: LysR family transcriptional regulator [Erwiniaceae]MBK0002160.1 LysR family transcriptional regulator [Erwinia sp. S38]MBK0033559.1 LysR family transcriptional regulator [Erwinia sp. S43]MBM7345195.1 DNA-binding transcriptional LysR family regulator [Pantoea coffeiphila]MCW1874179.1 LysR family transcriptional regulator [Erwinia sp. INIA01]PRD17042.1 LysR family transcriptional regulator [Pantoea coffeiphila]
MLKDLRDVALFNAIASGGTLSAAGRQLGISLAVVSKRLTQMEQQLGVRLFHRTTRHVSLTDEGLVFAEHAARLQQELEAIDSALANRLGRASGTLRITASHSMGQRWLAPILNEFMIEHPGVKLQLHLSDRVIDLAASGYDLAIRYGALADSRLVARELVGNRRVLCASPGYAARHGLPQTLEELSAHCCIVTGDAPMTEWRFGSDEEQRSVPINSRLQVNTGEAAHALALNDAGIAMKSIWDVAGDLRDGRLLTVLGDYPLPAAPLHAIWLSGLHQPPRVRLFVEKLRLQLAQHWNDF